MIHPTKPPDDELARVQAAYDLKAAREGLPPVKFWIDPCLEVDFSDFEEHYLAPARARREATAREQP